MDWTVIGTGIGIVSAVYAFMRNFKIDISSRMDKMELRMDKIEHRIEIRLDSMDERIFLLATGKTLKEAMMEARQKQEDRK